MLDGTASAAIGGLGISRSTHYCLYFGFTTRHCNDPVERRANAVQYRLKTLITLLSLHELQADTLGFF